MTKRLVSFDDEVDGTGLPTEVVQGLNNTYAPVSGSTAYAPASALFAAPASLARSPETVISTFGSGHGWTASGAWGTSNISDNGQQGWAAQAITGTTDGAGGGCNFVKTGSVPAFDPTGKNYTIYMKCSDPARLGSLMLYVSADTGSSFTNDAHWTVLGGSAAPMFPNEWFPVNFTQEEPAIAGTGPGTLAKALKLRFADKGGGVPITVSVGGMSVWSKPTAHANGMVSLTFDDSYKSHRTIAQHHLSRYRFRGTVFPIMDRMGLADRMTEADLIDLEKRLGWEVGGHGSTADLHQTGYPALSSTDLDAELRKVKTWLLSLGLRARSFAYPKGAYNEDVARLTARYFTCARTTESARRDVYPAGDPARLRAFVVNATHTLENVTTLIDAAYTYGHHLVLVFHDITSGIATDQQWSGTNLGALVDYIAAKGIPVRPLGEVYT